jgi:hypothetical protein
MSSPCVLPLTPAATQARMLKRSRGAAGEDVPTPKACKQSPTASPQKAAAAADMSPATSVIPATSAAAVAAALEAEDPMSPFLLACNNIRYAITFIQNSRRHALALCLQNQWERALAVLEKIERANDKISRQRRRTVLEQANNDAAVRAASDLLTPAAASNEGKPLSKKRSVRFSDDVAVGEAEALDRSPAPMPMLLRDEILVLRASRPIPVQNFSEFWG